MIKLTGRQGLGGELSLQLTAQQVLRQLAVVSQLLLQYLLLLCLLLHRNLLRGCACANRMCLSVRTVYLCVRVWMHTLFACKDWENVHAGQEHTHTHIHTRTDTNTQIYHIRLDWPAATLKSPHILEKMHPPTYTSHPHPHPHSNPRPHTPYAPVPSAHLQ